MANHRRRCGPTAQGSSEIQKLVQTKIDSEETDPIDQGDVLWSTPTDNIEEFIDESVAVEKVSQTAMQIIDNDIRRHRKCSKSTARIPTKCYDASLSSFLIGCNLPFDIVDSPHFKKFANQLNPSYIVPSSSQLKARIIQQLQSMEPSPKRRRNYETSNSDTD